MYIKTLLANSPIHGDDYFSQGTEEEINQGGTRHTTCGFQASLLFRN